MQTQLIIDSVRGRLITNFSAISANRVHLGTGNIVQCEDIEPLPQYDTQYIALAYGGTLNLPDWAGGWHRRNWILNVGTFVGEEGGEYRIFNQSNKDIILIEQYIVKALSFYYVPLYMAEPMQHISSTKPQRINYKGKNWTSIVQQFRILNRPIKLPDIATWSN